MRMSTDIDSSYSKITSGPLGQKSSKINLIQLVATMTTSDLILFLSLNYFISIVITIMSIKKSSAIIYEYTALKRLINNSLFLLQNKPVDDCIPDKPLVPQVLQLHAHSFGIPT